MNITINGETRSLQDWAKLRGLSRDTIRKRVKSGMSLQDAINTPRTEFPRIVFRGKRLTIEAWSKETGIDARTIAYRLKNGWSVSEALTKVPPARSL